MSNIPKDRWVILLTDDAGAGEHPETVRGYIDDLRRIAVEVADGAETNHFEFLIGGPRPKLIEPECGKLDVERSDL